ncbi:MAG: response regulator [Candidatus Krumholzibacteria bacterium]|nr:response regulator [Candidatus Krumholzibacteria bacterium]
MAKILIIDDDAGVRDVMSRALARDGHEVATAADGNEGLSAARREPPDLVITDIFMPEREGLDTIMELRKLRPELPIMAISGGGHFATGDYLRVARDMGAAITLSKPINLRRLSEAVNTLLGEGGPPDIPRIKSHDE